MKVQFMVTLEMTEEPKHLNDIEQSIRNAILRENRENGLTAELDGAVVHDVSVHHARMITLINNKNIKA